MTLGTYAGGKKGTSLISRSLGLPQSATAAWGECKAQPVAGRLDPRRAALRLRYRCQMLATGGESLLGVGEEQTYEDLLGDADADVPAVLLTRPVFFSQTHATRLWLGGRSSRPPHRSIAPSDLAAQPRFSRTLWGAREIA
jgi:hypothetical protein